jgi:hypothetical protein
MCMELPTLREGCSQTLDHNREFYKSYFRGKKEGETDKEYILAGWREIGAEACSGSSLLDIPYGQEFKLNFMDGTPAVHVYRGAMSPGLTKHFLHVSKTITKGFLQCKTRGARTVHLGAKEYNPTTDQQQLKTRVVRQWTKDRNVQDEDIQKILPELTLADKILGMVSPNTHNKCCSQVPEQYRLAKTAFTFSTLNTSECSLHRDHCFGLDVILYAGDWEGGGLELPQILKRIMLKPGDAVVMDSILFHQVQKKAGDRVSISFFTKNYKEKSAANNILEVPSSLVWLSTKNFGLF